MNGFLEPRSVAVVGASADPRRGGYHLVANLAECLKERIYPVNPRYEEICGLPCYGSVLDLPESVDLCIVFVPAPDVPKVLDACGKKGIRRVMIQSAGFAETGEQGRRLQDRCVQIARQTHLRLWGPNCMGMLNGRKRIVASFMRPDIWRENLRGGGVSLIVQSGMLAAGFLMQILSDGYFGLSHACSIGNRCDVNECDLLEHFAQDSATEVVALYLESVADGARFRRAVAALGRPVILLKGGTSPGGAQAAVSHTASLAGDAQVAEGLFRQLGVHRAHDFVELMDLTKALALWRGRTRGGRVAVVTFSGAAGIVCADHLARRGMTLSPLSPSTIQKLREILPPWMEPANPVDIWPAIERVGRVRAYGAALQALAADPLVDAIHAHLYVDARIAKGDMAFLQPLAHAPKPAALWIIGDTAWFGHFRSRSESLGVPVYREIERGVRALSLMMGESS